MRNSTRSFFSSAVNTYAYVSDNPLSFTDPTGTGPTGSLVGGTITGIIVGIAGIETGPGDALLVAGARSIGAGIGSAIEDALHPPVSDWPDSIMEAQNNRQRRARIASLQENIDEHRKKLENEPNCPAANHWRSEIRTWEDEINRIQKRLPNGN